MYGNDKRPALNVASNVSLPGLTGSRFWQREYISTFSIAVPNEAGPSARRKSTQRLIGGPLAPPGLAQRDEQGVELFYNASLTPWCHFSGDLQIVQPSTKAVDTTVLIGARLKIDL